MKNVRAVTAYVPLPVTHLSQSQYHALAGGLIRACDGNISVFYDSLANCWLWHELQKYPPLPPAAPRPADRYPTDAINIMSHIIQHNRTTWAKEMFAAFPEVDVAVWFDYGLMKQGAWNNKPVQPEHVAEFLIHVANYDFHDLPFPGIEEKKPINIHGNNWRFCGSTHVWTRETINVIDDEYKRCLREFIKTHLCVPLDLTIWPMVENNVSVPFRWYKAEYDHTQLTEFPHARPDPALLARQEAHDGQRGQAQSV